MTGPTQRRTLQPPADRSWHARAACKKDPDLFFHPENETGSPKAQRIAAAKAICAECPVLATCQASTLQEVHGIWGGRSEDERAAIRAGNPAGSTKFLQAVPVAGMVTRTKRTLDPAPLIAHLNGLIDAGFNPTAIGRFAGVAPETVRAIAKGLKAEVYTTTAQKLLSVQVREMAA